MSQVIGIELTQALFERLSGKDIDAHEGKIIPIFTIDEQGWAHPGLLSYYEVVAMDASTLDMALWKDSSTARNLRRTGKLTLMISDRSVNYYLKGNVRELQHDMAGAAPVSRFRVTLEQVVETKSPMQRSPRA